jgi:hypothetical protein
VRVFLERGTELQNKFDRAPFFLSNQGLRISFRDKRTYIYTKMIPKTLSVFKFHKVSNK